jgi:hypothetical protein
MGPAGPYSRSSAFRLSRRDATAFHEPAKSGDLFFNTITLYELVYVDPHSAELIDLQAPLLVVMQPEACGYVLQKHSEYPFAKH